MADEIDFEAARSGDKDLARRDLRGAHLEKADLSGVDLTGAHLKRAHLNGADLSGSTLKGAHLMEANMNGANLAGITAPSTVFFAVSLVGADLRGSNLSECHLSQSNLNSADLRGANLRETSLNEGTDFTDAIVDETTIFDGAHILRPMASQNAFRFYDVERGMLVRRKDGPRPDIASSKSAPPIKDNARDEVTKRIRELLDALAPLKLSEEFNSLSPGRGHNNPPEPTPLEHTEFEDLTTTLSTLTVELHQNDIRPEVISDGAEKVDRASSKIAAWVARKADLAADECAKQLGKSLADARVWMATWLMISGKLTALVELLVGFAPH